MRVLEVAVALMPGALMVALSGCGGAASTPPATVTAVAPAASVTAAAPQATEFKSTVAGVNFDKMTPAMKTNMQTNCATAFATSLGVNPSQVSIGLSKGSVNVVATVQPAAGQTIDATRMPVAAAITTAVTKVAGINAAQDPGATISASLPIATPPTVAPAVAPAVVPTVAPVVAPAVATAVAPVVSTKAAAAPCNLKVAAEAMKGCIKGLKPPVGKGAPPSVDVMKAAMCTFAQSAVKCVTTSAGSCLNTQFKTLLPQVVAEMKAEGKGKGKTLFSGGKAPTCAQIPQLCELTPGNVCNEAMSMVTTGLAAANWTCALQCGVAAAPAAISAAEAALQPMICGGKNCSLPAGQTLGSFMQQAVTGKIGKGVAMLTNKGAGKGQAKGDAQTAEKAMEKAVNSTAATPIVADAEKVALTLVNSTLTESIAVAATRLFELPVMIAPEDGSVVITDGGDTLQGNHLGSYAAVVALMGFIALVVVLRRGTGTSSARAVDVGESELEGALDGLE